MREGGGILRGKQPGEGVSLDGPGLGAFFERQVVEAGRRRAHGGDLPGPQCAIAQGYLSKPTSEVVKAGSGRHGRGGKIEDAFRWAKDNCSGRGLRAVRIQVRGTTVVDRDSQAVPEARRKRRPAFQEVPFAFATGPEERAAATQGEIAG